MSFPRYPAYKDSGVKWLGEVPEHWDVKPVKHLAELDSCGSYGVEPDNAEIVLPVATTAQMDSHGRFSVEQMPQRGFLAVEVERYGCSDGDILIVKSSGSATNIISGKAGLVDGLTPPFVFSNFLMRIRPLIERSLPKFLYGQLRSNLTRQRVELMCSTTTYPNLKVGEYMSALLPTPPLPEQSQIAAFLDRETAKIDELVAEQRRLIELLKEKRQAVISHAVTKGLNPDAPMKPSGVEWLGDVPEHWHVRKVRWLCEIKKRIAGRLGYDVLSITQKGIKVKDLESNDGQLSMDYSKYQLVEVGDFAMNHMDLLTGFVDLASAFGVTSPDYRVFTIREPAISNEKYLLYLFQMGYNDKIFYAYGQGSSQLGRWRLPTDQFNDLVLPLPPMGEQQEIANFLDLEIAKIDEVVAEQRLLMALLQERRGALITAAVTGQIDVRQLAEKETA